MKQKNIWYKMHILPNLYVTSLRICSVTPTLGNATCYVKLLAVTTAFAMTEQ